MVVKLPLTIFIQELKVQGNLIIVYQLTHEHFKHVNNTHWQKKVAATQVVLCFNKQV